MIEVVLRGEAEQLAFGAELARACSQQRVLLFLEGDLGAGKTTLVRGLLHGLGHKGTVKSPTYTLIEPYVIDGRRVYHLDLYRVADPSELEYLGLREILAEPALVLVEWPQRGAGWLPAPDLALSLQHLDGARRVRIDAIGEVGEALVERLHRNLQ